MKLIDSHGRQIRKLRLSLLDACNFRCNYCMPEDVSFSPAKSWISVDEMERVCKTLIAYGLEEVRITGGEPTLRKDFREVVSRFSKLPLKKLALTTNGFRLKDHVEFLKGTSLRHLNISLDSLHADRFKQITKVDGLSTVLESIWLAQKEGFTIKLNVVLMRGLNDTEVLDFVRFSEEYGLEVRFLELMRIGHVREKQNDLFVSAGEALSQINQKFFIAPLESQPDSTSFNYKTKDGGKIGFIASESKPFCGGCSRWRLSADGFLRACLMKSDGLSVREKTEEELGMIFQEVLKMKPIERIFEVKQNMNEIGG